MYDTTTNFCHIKDPKYSNEVIKDSMKSHQAIRISKFQPLKDWTHLRSLIVF